LNELLHLKGAHWHALSFATLVSDVNRDCLSLRVIEPVDGVHHEEHDDAEAEDGDEEEANHKARPDGEGEEPDAVVGATKLAVFDLPHLHLAQTTEEFIIKTLLDFGRFFIKSPQVT